MNQYLLSTYAVEGAVEGSPNTPEEMQAFMKQVMNLEAEMDASDTFVFGGALDHPGSASVVHVDADSTEGPFLKAKGQLAGFYIINADNLEDALKWANKVAKATNHSIEIRPFRATGRVADHMREMPKG